MSSVLEKVKTNKELVGRAIHVAWPAILESFFVALVAMVDSYMVSGLGSYAVAAIGLTTQPKFICLALFIAINMAVSALVARRKGQGERDSANRILLTAIICCVVGIIVISSIAVALADPIIHLVGSEPQTHDSAVLYFRIIIGCIIFNVISLVINAAQRGSGNTKIAMRTNVTSNVVNVIFNYLLIHGNLGFPALGVAGAAIATVLGTVVACGMSIASLFRKDSYVSIPYMIQKKLPPTVRALKDIASFASTVFAEQLMLRFGFFMSALLTANLGTEALAAHQVGMNALHLSFSFGDGLQVAAVTLIGQSLGQGNKALAKKYGNICQSIGLAISIGLSIIYLLFGRWFFGIYFPNEPHIVDLGVSIIKYMIIIVLFQVSQVVFGGSLRGAGDVRFTTVTSMISVAIIRPSISYIAAYVLQLGITGIWIGVLADQAVRLVMSGLRFRSGRWMNKEI
jgi:putative MATE family efflux protein